MENHPYGPALADFRRAVQLFPTNSEVLVSVAWFLATCPDKLCRNGPAAVSAAQQACDLLGHPSGYYLEALAAACAEAGDFGQAVESQQKALRLLGAGNASNTEMLQRLALYEKKKPCHKLLVWTYFE